MSGNEQAMYLSGAIGLAPNVSLKVVGNSEPMIVRNLKSLFCTMATVKVRDNFVMMDFAHPDVLIPKKSDEPGKDPTMVTFVDYEFEPSASIVMPLETLELLHKKISEVLEAKKSTPSQTAGAP